MGFASKFIPLIGRCIAQLTLSVLVNGAPTGYLVANGEIENGIPYPFILSV